MLKKRRLRIKKLILKNEELEQKVIDMQIKFNKLEEEYTNYKNKVNNKQ